VLPLARLPCECLGGAAPGGLTGVGLDEELGEVGHSEHQMQRAVVHPVGREVGSQLAVGLALATPPSPVVMHRSMDACSHMHPLHIHICMQWSRRV
jgi:hypothetical protein